MIRELASDFKQFILRGNVIDLGVGVVIGSAFNNVVSALVKDLLTPLISAVGGNEDFSSFVFTIHNSQFRIGDFINNLVSFLIVASAVYFFVVLPTTHLAKPFKKPAKEAKPTTKDCPFCLSQIPKRATRCPFCTSKLSA